MTVVGVTGKYCAGKDTATKILGEFGFVEIDVDALGHDALLKERERVVGRFGSRVASGDGSVNRAELARIVFKDRLALKDLESIVHPVMADVVKERIAACRETDPRPAGVVVNAAVLFRMGLTPLCDKVLYVYAPFAVRYRRAKQRDGAGFLAVVRRLAAQRDVSPQYSLPNADIHSVQNDGSQEQLRERLKGLLSLP